MYIGKYIHLVHRTEVDLAEALRQVSKAHSDEVDIEQICELLASWSEELAVKLEPVARRHKQESDNEPDRLTKTLMKETRTGNMALLRDLHDLYLIVSEVLVCCTILKQGGTALKDKELVLACEEIERQTTRQASWLMTRMKSAAPQTLIVAE